MAWSYCYNRFVQSCHLDLKLTYFLHVVRYCILTAFMLHESQCTEVSSIAEHLAEMRSHVDS